MWDLTGATLRGLDFSALALGGIFQVQFALCGLLISTYLLNLIERLIQSCFVCAIGARLLFVVLKCSQLLSWQWQYAILALLASVHGSSTLSLTRPTQLLCFRRQRRNAFPALLAADAPLTDTGSRTPRSFSASGGSGDMRSLRCSCCCWRRQWRPWPVRSTCKTLCLYCAVFNLHTKSGLKV